MREQDISPRKDFPAQPGPPPPGACRDVCPARGPDAQWRRLCRGKGRDCLQRLACADVAATRARLAGPGSRRKRHTAKGGQRVGGCRLREVRRGCCCGCVGDADEANRVHEIATLARSYLLWGCFGGVIVRMAHYGVLREAESGSA
jgi:hypothetical protein